MKKLAHILTHLHIHKMWVHFYILSGELFQISHQLKSSGFPMECICKHNEIVSDSIRTIFCPCWAELIF